MINPFQKRDDRTRIDEEAASWMWRLDRGLSPEEQDAFFDWMAADTRHAESLAQYRQNWKKLDLIAEWRPEHSRHPNPDLLAPRRPSWRNPVFLGGMAAAVAAILLVLTFLILPAPMDPEGSAVVAELNPDSRRVLSDDSTVKLNDGAELEILFTAAERRVRLKHGEGFFMVARDPDRPFIVEASGVEVRAVGTAFNVRLKEKELDVLVAEGKVSVSSRTIQPGPQRAAYAPVTFLEASQRTVIPFEVPASLEVATLSKKDVQEALAWQHGTVSFDAKPLHEIVDELNLLNGRQLVIHDRELGAMRFSGTFRTDNLEGFVRLLEVGFGVRSEENGPERIILRAR